MINDDFFPPCPSFFLTFSCPVPLLFLYILFHPSPLTPHPLQNDVAGGDSSSEGCGRLGVGLEEEGEMAAAPFKQVVVGICAMEKKSGSKPMKEILTRLEEFEYLRPVIFPEEVILKVSLGRREEKRRDFGGGRMYEDLHL